MEPTANILLVDDNATLREQLTMRLEAAGYGVLSAKDGLEALDVLEEARVDLILADIAMPRLNGYQLIQRVRENPAWVCLPFIVMTARTLDSDIRFGKELGVDDYLTKPVHPEDLLASVRGRLVRARQLAQARIHRRVSPAPSGSSHRLTLGDLEIDPQAHQVYQDGQPVRLSAREFKLLLALAKEPGKVRTPQELVEATHGYQTERSEASMFIRPMIRTLRRKLGYETGERGCLENIHGVGYRLVNPGS